MRLLYVNPGKIRPRKKLLWLGMLILAGGIYLAGGISDSQPKLLLAGGQQLGLVTGENQVNHAAARAKDELTKEYGLAVKGLETKLSYESLKEQQGQEVLTDDNLVALLKEKLEWRVAGYALVINGKNTLYLREEALAREVIEEFKNKHISQEDQQAAAENIHFAEEIKIEAGDCLLKDLVAPGRAVEILAAGLDKIEEYTVKNGDTLWTIARDYNLTVAELKEANTQLKGDFLKIGQKLNLKKAEPLLTVVYTQKVTLQEKVPYSTVYENDHDLYRNQEKIKQKGIYGSREVTYLITKANGLETDRQTLAEKVLSQAVSQIVLKGTKSVTVASRGGQWEGQIVWPVRGPITSGYGYRIKGKSREFHNAIDIDGVTGDPVSAAADGVVTFAGWSGNYGKCVVIDHGSGMVTRYAHLSTINVKVEDKVTSGSLIGRVGSTGRSTGSHLHFEVWINGVTENPLIYLNR